MTKKKLNHLFITYDGLLDPLGGSQIIPYLKSISKPERKIQVISFEKNKNIKLKKINSLRQDLLKSNIFWKYNKFSENYGQIGKIYDLIKMFFFSLFLVLFKNIQIIHCRSHIPATVGFFLKKILKIKLVFDFRGLWIEERFDYKIWNKKKILHNLYFKILKKLEKKILNNSDYIVCLTDSVKPYLNNKLYKKVPIEVIPCCADYIFFKKNNYSKKEARQILKLKENISVIGYAGSINEVYLIQNMINFFALLSKKNKNLIFIFVTHQTDQIKKIIDNKTNKKIKKNIKIFKAERENIPLFLSSFDLMLCFIKKTFSRTAMSPTKMFESFASGIPFICNKGIGDVDLILKKHKVGAVLDLKRGINRKKNFELYNQCKKIKPSYIIKKTKPFYDIKFAQDKYNHIYKILENDQK